MVTMILGIIVTVGALVLIGDMVHVGVTVIMIHSMTPSMIHGIIADITAMDIPIMVMQAGMAVGIVHGITAAIMAIHIMVAM